MQGYTRAWLAWGGATALGFTVIEAKAMRPDQTQPATLSSHLRLVFGFDDRGPVPALRRAAFYATWGWFGLHILRHTTQCVSCITPTIPHS